MTETKPKLPAKSGKKAAANSKQLPILQAQYLTLEDGTQVPMKIPPHMPPEQAQMLMQFLKSNPDAAKQVYEQAKVMMQSPGLANAFLNLQNNVRSNHTEQLAVLKDDPELKHIFEEIQTQGPQAMQKYWDDTDLMSKISAKLREMKVDTQQQPDQHVNAGAHLQRQRPISSLYDAAKQGDEAAAIKYIQEGADVNAKNERGITALGIAVGFNKLAMISLLLEKGADVNITDAAGNTVLHYAAGYGRKEAAQLLLQAGADVNVANNNKQKPIDVARLNKEKLMVEFLEQQSGEAAQ